MKGTRPLDNDEIRRVSAAFTGMYEIRNRGLFMLGVSTGCFGSLVRDSTARSQKVTCSDVRIPHQNS